MDEQARDSAETENAGQATADEAAQPAATEHEQAPPAGKRRRRRGCLIKAGVGVLILLVLLVGAALAYGAYWRGRLDAEIERLRAEGQPVTWDEVLAAREQIPDERNSALIFQRAAATLPEDDPADELMRYLSRDPDLFGRMPSPQLRRLMAAWLEARSEALGLVHEGARFERGAWPVEWPKNPVLVNLPHLNGVRELARLCVRDAAQRAVSGDASGVVHSLVACRRVGSSIGDEPTISSALVRMAIRAITVDGIEQALALCELPAEALEDLSDELARAGDESLLRLALLGERAGWMGFYTCPAGRLNEWSEGERVGAEPLDRLPGYRGRDGGFYLAWMGRLLSAAGMPARERIREAEAIEDGLIAAEDAASKYLYVYSLLVLPVIPKCIPSDAKSKVRLDVAATALAVERYRLDNARWPDSLDQLVPDYLAAVPEDPFAPAGTLRYIHGDDECVVYSYGQDQEDNKGLHQREVQGKAREAGQPTPLEGWDISFRLLDPEKRGVASASFRKEFQELDDRYLDEFISALQEFGFTAEELRAAGFTDEEMEHWPADEDDGTGADD